MDLPLEHGHLAVEDLHQVPQRLDLGVVAVVQLEVVELRGAPQPSQVVDRRVQAVLASTALTCALSPVRSASSFAR